MQSHLSELEEEDGEDGEINDADLENKLLGPKTSYETAGEVSKVPQEISLTIRDPEDEELDEVPPMGSPEHLTLMPPSSLIPGSLATMKLQQAALQIAAQVAKKEGKELKKLPRKVYWTIITGMILVSTVVISLNGEEKEKMYAGKTCFNSLLEQLRDSRH